MDNEKRFLCTICGECKRDDNGWFLLVEDAWLDRLKVLRWNSTLASQQQVHCLCSASHLRELVAHWMATGSLEYPFALVPTASEKVMIRGAGKAKVKPSHLEISSSGLIGELAVHRESLNRALSEHPQCLSTILEALLVALDPGRVQSKAATMRREEVAVI